MSSDEESAVRKELLDEFYAECDDLLEAIRGNLAALDEAVRAHTSNPAETESLFRGLHTLKGISAIAGLREAEELAHAMEDVLRGVARKQLPLSAEIVAALRTGEDRLERIISAHRVGQVAPSSSDVHSTLRQFQPGEAHPVAAAPTPAPAPTPSSLADAAQGRELWRCTFTPSKRLDQQGVNVTRVRERLGRIGEIINAAPSIVPGVGVSFVFTVAVREAPTDVESWTAEGVQLERVVPAAAPESPESAGPLAAPDLFSLTPSHLVRVDLARLDELMRITGDLIIHRSRLEARLRRERGDDDLLRELQLGLGRSLRELRKAITRVRLVPIGELFSRVPLVVRDLAAKADKRVRVVTEGSHTEIDKYLVEKLKEPLLHLVRNAFAHAIEPPAEREAAGKPPEATLQLRARSLGEWVEMRIRDDGRGIEASAIASRARALGLPVPESLDVAGVLRLLCTPGFSTRDEADRAAGRGMGMAVVANSIRELGGTLTFATTPGEGTEFTLRLPLTLSIADAIIVTVGEETCAVPEAAIDEIFQIDEAAVRFIKPAEVVPYRDGLLPLLRLRAQFQLPPAEGRLLTILVLQSERGAVGLVVDRVLARREIVVRPLTDALVRVPGFSGATELGDGRPILILDPAALTRGVVRPPSAQRTAPLAAASSLS